MPVRLVTLTLLPAASLLGERKTTDGDFSYEHICKLKTIELKYQPGGHPKEFTAAITINAMEEAEKRRKRGILKCRAYRFKHKAQFDELRNQDVQLSQELSYLKQMKKEKKIKEDATRTPTCLLWRDLAVRLGVERKHAGSQQKQLRFLVNNQAMYIDTLREILSKKSCGLMPPIDYNEFGCSLNKHLPAALLDRYIQELEARFFQTNDVFKGFDPSSLYNVQHVIKQGSYGVAKHFYPRFKLVFRSPCLKRFF